MEFEDIDERVEWEARRVMAAYGFEATIEKAREALAPQGTRGFYKYYRCSTPQLLLKWTERRDDDALVSLVISVPKARRGCHFVRHGDGWIVLVEDQQGTEFMARGLYRLGFEDEEELSQLPALSAHEKMELRLSMPREFWPKQWLEGKG